MNTYNNTPYRGFNNPALPTTFVTKLKKLLFQPQLFHPGRVYLLNEHLFI